jgi:hypothetical protein
VVEFVCDYKATPYFLGDASGKTARLTSGEYGMFRFTKYGVRLYQSVRVTSILICIVCNKAPTFVSQVTHLQQVDNGRIHSQIYRRFLVLVAQLWISTMAEQKLYNF